MDPCEASGENTDTNRRQSVSELVVGMIGIGQLGLPIAANLIGAGFKVVGFRRNDRAAFVAQGGHAMESPADVAKAADVLLLCLPGESAQMEVLDGPQGVLAALAPGKTVIELGTYTREFKQAQAFRIEATGAQVLEVEVSGSPALVTQRKAALYIGGDANVLEGCSNVLAGITDSRFHIGPFGSAVAVKLIANYLLTIHTLAAAEAVNMGRRAGFDPQQLVEVLRQGAGGSTMLTVRGPMMAAGAFSPAPGPFKTLEKYLDMGASLADELGCATPLFSAALPYFRRALEGGMEDLDISAVIQLIEADSVAKPTNQVEQK
jgi:3-hydroxyisobutyrate dehydrogenase-like beta-hydroxyacid dehydrogenase